jgi:hypothetical protein
MSAGIAEAVERIGDPCHGDVLSADFERREWIRAVG